MIDVLAMYEQKSSEDHFDMEYLVEKRIPFVEEVMRPYGLTGIVVREGIAALPEKHQSVVVLYYLHRLSLQETAQVLGIQLGTVKSRLHYALRNLRVQLEGDRRFGGAYLPLANDDAEVHAS